MDMNTTLVGLCDANAVMGDALVKLNNQLAETLERLATANADKAAAQTSRAQIDRLQKALKEATLVEGKLRARIVELEADNAHMARQLGLDTSDTRRGGSAAKF